LKRDKEIRRENALISTLCPVCKSQFKVDTVIPKRLSCSHLHCLKCCNVCIIFNAIFFINFLILTLFFFPFTQKMFIQSRANISCGVCRKLTRIEPGKSVDESLESDLNCLDLTTGFQELHSDLVSTQDNCV
jgi:hypothetical protein